MNSILPNFASQDEHDEGCTFPSEIPEDLLHQRRHFWKSEYADAIKTPNFYSNLLKIKYGINVWSKLQIKYEC